MSRVSPRRPGEDERLWAVIAATVRPFPGRALSKPPPEPEKAAAKTPPRAPVAIGKSAAPPPPAPRPPTRPRGPSAPQWIEPNRLRQIDIGREPLTAVLDLHGLSQDAARSALNAFVERHFAAHHRAVMVITGKGPLGDGVLRRRVPEWLAEPPLRDRVAGISEAHRRKGGAGAIYVALKRNAGRT